ncbi:MAG: hypothetical protein K1W39_12880 [Lachnospiraceae bacterium]
MANKTIRLLRADEIECRVSSISKNGVSLLLYKDARVDQRILDETFGIFGWKRSHQCIDGNLYCTVEVFDKETGIWVSKQDAGSTGKSEKEKEKSQASDSFKRACFNWGIGRELYTAPFIWIPAGRAEIQERGGKFYCNDSFSVTTVSYNKEREITGLSIINSKYKVVYVMGADNSVQNVSSTQMASLKKELARTGVTADEVKERYHVTSLENMPDDIYKRVMSALSRTRTEGVA